jgi:chloramphenicol 3-O phosphotransferase
MEHLIPGKIILLNGVSSAGKSTLCRAVQAEIDEPFLQFSLDFLMFDTGVLPKRRNPSGPFSWASMKPKLFQGYFGCLTALARAGNNLVLGYVLETHEQLEQLVRALKTLDVFFVGVHCPLPELGRRERERGDRPTGDAKRDFGIVHNFSSYDFEFTSGAMGS